MALHAGHGRNVTYLEDTPSYTAPSGCSLAKCSAHVLPNSTSAPTLTVSSAPARASATPPATLAPPAVPATMSSGAGTGASFGSST